MNTIHADTAKELRLKIDDPTVTLSAVHAWSHVHGLSRLILDGQLDHVAVDLERLVDAVIDNYQLPVLPRRLLRLRRMEKVNSRLTKQSP